MFQPQGLVNKGPGMISAIFGLHLEVYQTVFFSSQLLNLNFKMKNSGAPAYC